MNEHRSRQHQGSPALTSLVGLQTCLAGNTGRYNSLVEIVDDAVSATADFRNASQFEARVGLLRHGILFCEGEEAGLGQVPGACFPTQPDNPHLKAVADFLSQADTLCKSMGSTHCRQQAMRDFEGNVSPKCFHPVLLKTAKEYAVNVAKFIFFCERADWPGRGAVSPTHTVSDVLRAVLMQKCESIRQTFVTR